MPKASGCLSEANPEGAARGRAREDDRMRQTPPERRRMAKGGYSRPSQTARAGGWMAQTREDESRGPRAQRDRGPQSRKRANRASYRPRRCAEEALLRREAAQGAKRLSARAKRSDRKGPRGTDRCEKACHAKRTRPNAIFRLWSGAIRECGGPFSRGRTVGAIRRARRQATETHME